MNSNLTVLINDNLIPACILMSSQTLVFSLRYILRYDISVTSLPAFMTSINWARNIPKAAEVSYSLFCSHSLCSLLSPSACLARVNIACLVFCWRINTDVESDCLPLRTHPNGFS